MWHTFPTPRRTDMKKKYEVTYRAVLHHRTKIIEATSKYDAKQRFYRKYPNYEVISIVEVEE